MTINWTEIILAVIAFLSGWIVTRKKNRLDLSTEFVAKFRTLIAEPLEAEVNRLRIVFAEASELFKIDV